MAKNIVTVEAHFITNNTEGERTKRFTVDGNRLEQVTQFWLLPLVDESGERIDRHAILNMGFVRYIVVHESKPAVALAS